jgi:hypothetical protein
MRFAQNSGIPELFFPKQTLLSKERAQDLRAVPFHHASHDLAAMVQAGVAGDFV